MSSFEPQFTCCLYMHYRHVVSSGLQKNYGRLLKKGNRRKGLFLHKGKRVLTHYQTTNFRLFQTERVCRRQFEVLRIRKKVIQIGRKHCGKRRNCSLRAISPLPTVFSKGLFPRGVKRRHCVGIC